MTWRRIGVHRNLLNCTITESYDTETEVWGFPVRRFVATICGFGNWKLGDNWTIAQAKAREIRDRIEAGDETVFKKGGY